MNALVQLVGVGQFEAYYFNKINDMDAKSFEPIEVEKDVENIFIKIIPKLADTMKNIIFHLKVDREIDQKELYNIIDYIEIKSFNHTIIKVTGDYLYRNILIKRFIINEKSKSWIFDFPFRDFGIKYLNLLAINLDEICLTIKVREHVKLSIYSDCYIYANEKRKELMKGTEKEILLEPVIKRLPVINGKIKIPNIDYPLFDNSFWLKMPNKESHFEMNELNQDSYGDGLYWIQFNENISNKELKVHFEEEVIFMADKIGSYFIKNGVFNKEI